MRFAIQFINIEPENDHIIKRWYDTERFDTREEAYASAQCAVRCSQHLIKRGQVFYRIICAD